MFCQALNAPKLVFGINYAPQTP